LKFVQSSMIEKYYTKCITRMRGMEYTRSPGYFGALIYLSCAPPMDRGAKVVFALSSGQKDTTHLLNEKLKVLFLHLITHSLISLLY
jgi:hypothetical protein